MSSEKYTTLRKDLQNDHQDCPSPIMVHNVTRGTRGCIKYSKVANTVYHDLQTCLLKKLEKFNEQFSFSPNPKIVPDAIKDRNDSFFWEIDQYTYQFCLHANCMSGQGTLLGEVFALSFIILLGRVIVDWQEYNDLMKDTEWSNWRNHTCIIASFAALTCVTLLILKIMKQKFNDDQSPYNSNLDNLINKVYKTFDLHYIL